MPDFADFDERNYPTVSAREGYGAWTPTYESTVEDAMDHALLERITSVAWPAVASAVDLGCGTGRTGVWLRAHGVCELHGIDVTPEMIELAREKKVYASLSTGDVSASGLDAASHDLVTCCLVDEHLAELAPLYTEAARLLRTGGAFVLVGFHPFFVMSTGMPTHFDHPERGPLAVETHIHLLSDHVAAARAADLHLDEMHERLIDDEWLQLKPKWAKHKDWPISFACVWRI